jgi:hypothetical protein
VGTLLVATAARSWGEAVFARRLAEQLKARGDRVVALAPTALIAMFRDVVDRLGLIDPLRTTLPDAIPRVARAERCTDVVLVDLTTVYMHLESTGHDHALAPALAAAGLRAAALDVWNLAATDLRWDFGEGRGWQHSRHVRDIAARLCPAPLASPRAASAYAGLGPDQPVSAGERRDVRAQLGLATDAPLIVTTTAGWQLPDVQSFPGNRSLAERVPGLLGQIVEAAVAEATLVHIGPVALPGLASSLGARYRWLAQLPPAQFESVIGAADVLLTTNLAATSIATAISRHVPVIVVQHAPDACARGSVVDTWLAGEPPPLPFRVWPMGLHEFLRPVLADNPYVDALTHVELVDQPALEAALRELVEPGPARTAAIERQLGYAAAVRALPCAAEVLDRELARL